MRFLLLLSALFLAAGPATARLPAPAGAPQEKSNADAAQDRFPPNFVPSGKMMFRQYCAACHGSNAKGRGPARSALKVPAPDLTTLTKRHGGEFPYDYVSGILMFGPGVAAHGSADMPTWGPIFQYLDKYNQTVVQKRIKNLCDYLASLQGR